MSTRLSLAMICGMLLIASIFLPGCKDATVDYPARSMPDELSTDTRHISSGEELFAGKCASCHGKPSEGRSDRAIFFDPPAPDFTNRHYQKVDPAYLYWRIETGKNVEPYLSQGSVMPAWGLHLSEEEIWQLVAFLKQRST